MAPPHPYRHHPYAQPRNATAAEIATSVPPPSNPPTLVQTCRNRRASSINRVLWTPSSMTHRRLVTGSHNGEITLWNCDSFIHEGTFQAHECAIRSMKFTHDGEYIYMVSGDDGGTMRYWNREMTNVHVKDEAHQESIRDFSFAVTSTKLCSCSDDTTIKIWDFATCREVNRLTGHGWNVTSVDWHPTKGLVGSGGRDSCVKLWEPRIGMELCTFYDHKNWVNSVKWNKNGHWLLAASKDQTVKLFDMRVMKVLKTFRGHGSEVTALAWHPIQEEYFSSGSRDGSIFHWRVGSETPQAEVRDAHSGSHNNSVWDLQWHPSGDFLCSGSNDRTTKFWCNINVNGSFSDHNSASSDVMICDSSNEITPTVSLDSQKDGTIYIPGKGNLADRPSSVTPTLLFVSETKGDKIEE